MKNTINLKLIIILMSSIILIGCEKETNNELSKHSEISGYVDYSWYHKQNRQASPQGNDRVLKGCGLPYYWVTQAQTTVDLDDDRGDCLRTNDGDCFPEVVVVGYRSFSSNNSPYDIFSSYDGAYIEYFNNENWKELLPMLKPETVDLIASKALKLHHYYNSEKGIAYFRFVKINETQDNLFTIQLVVNEL